MYHDFTRPLVVMTNQAWVTFLQAHSRRMEHLTE